MHVIFASFEIWMAGVWASLGALAFVGLLAIVSPSKFSALSSRGSRWVDTSKVLAQLDRRVDVDQYILPYARFLGVAVLASVAFLGWLLVG